jgi:hypothetical protein
VIQLEAINKLSRRLNRYRVYLFQTSLFIPLLLERKKAIFATANREQKTKIMINEVAQIKEKRIDLKR